MYSTYIIYFFFAGRERIFVIIFPFIGLHELVNKPCGNLIVGPHYEGVKSKYNTSDPMESLSLLIIPV